MSLSNLIPIGISVLAIIAVIIFLCRIYKVADIDKALIITGGKEPIIKISGGGFVVPIFRKASYFDLCMITVKADNDEIQTNTSVPIVIDWTAQIRPDITNLNNLKKCIISFKERGKEQIINDVKQTLMGSLRNVVTGMTPQAVLVEKETFAKAVIDNVADEMINMGFELVSLNIQEITDRNGYYNDIAAKDREEKKKEAEKVRAITGQQIREQNTESEKIAKQKELDTELQIAEKTKDNNLKQAAFKIETDKANADAEIAGELQKTVRQKEIETEKGAVEIVRQEQANLAALKQQDVIKTKAESEKIKAEIEANQQAEVANINAEAKANVAKKNAEGEANAIKIEAEANANATKTKGNADAEVIKITGLAEAEKNKQIGLAEAEVAREKGLAEAEAEKAKLLAKAEGEKALAEARSGNDKVNFEIEKLKIEAQARVEIATQTAKVMADVGKNAEFVNLGGGINNTGNAFLDTLSGVPKLLKTLDVENKALSSNDKSFNEEISDLVSAVATPLKDLGLLSTSKKDSTLVENNDNVTFDVSE